MTDLDHPATSATVFAAARAATFRRTNLGRMAEVTVKGVTYRVVVEPRHRAHIDYRTGFGGPEYLTAHATPEQDRALRTALALRTAGPPRPAIAPTRHRRRR